MIWETDWEKVTDTENQRTLELALKERTEFNRMGMEERTHLSFQQRLKT